MNENSSGRGTPSGQAVLVFPTNSTSMLDIFVGLARFSVSSPLIIAEGADDWEPCLVRPVPSPVRRKTTDSVRRIDNEFFVDGMCVAGRSIGSRNVSKHCSPSFIKDPNSPPQGDARKLSGLANHHVGGAWGRSAGLRALPLTTFHRSSQRHAKRMQSEHFSWPLRTRIPFNAAQHNVSWSGHGERCGTVLGTAGYRRISNA